MGLRSINDSIIIIIVLHLAVRVCLSFSAALIWLWALILRRSIILSSIDMIMSTYSQTVYHSQQHWYDYEHLFSDGLSFSAALIWLWALILRRSIILSSIDMIMSTYSQTVYYSQQHWYDYEHLFSDVWWWARSSPRTDPYSKVFFFLLLLQ